jgi:hypothetical protein
MSVTNNVEKMIQPAIIEITETDMAFSRVQLIRSAQISSSDHLKLEKKVNLVVKHPVIMKPNHELARSHSDWTISWSTNPKIFIDL